MRIVAGEWKGRVLCAPNGGDVTRPTSDRVRESLFSILLPRLGGARALDLFAGSGALALEALSRGADFAVLCDRDKNACEATLRNIDALGARDRTLLLRMDAIDALSVLAQKGERFDVIFLDPPYRAGLMPDVMQAIARGGLLARDGVIVAERASIEPPGQIPGYAVAMQRRYGAAILTFYTSEVLK